MTQPTPHRQRFTLTLIDADNPADPPAEQRLRAALKRLLRSHGLKCERVAPVEQEQEIKP